MSAPGRSEDRDLGYEHIQQAGPGAAAAGRKAERVSRSMPAAARGRAPGGHGTRQDRTSAAENAARGGGLASRQAACRLRPPMAAGLTRGRDPAGCRRIGRLPEQLAFQAYVARTRTSLDLPWRAPGGHAAEAARIPGVRYAIDMGDPAAPRHGRTNLLRSLGRALRRHGTWTGRTRRGRRGVLGGEAGMRAATGRGDPRRADLDERGRRRRPFCDYILVNLSR